MKNNQLLRRRDKILELLARQEEMTVSQLNASLDVSNETVRKDLIEMERQGMVLRKHGRVSLVEKNKDDAMGLRMLQNQPAKERIAREAIRHIPEGEAFIGMDSGNTAWHVAKLLVKDPKPIIVTNSLQISTLYAQEGNCNIYCAGGILRSNDLAFYGYWTRDNIKSINMTVTILGTPGIMGRDGIGSASFDDRDIKQLYVKNSKKVIAVFDSSKCTRGALVEGVPWDDIDLVITDKEIPEADRERIEKRTKLILV